MQQITNSAQLMDALHQLRDALQEMALMLSDYQYEIDEAQRAMAQDQVQNLLQSFGASTTGPSKDAA